MTITIYSRPACVQCTATYRALDNEGLDYTIVDITRDSDAHDSTASKRSPQPDSPGLGALTRRSAHGRSSAARGVLGPRRSMSWTHVLEDQDGLGRGDRRMRAEVVEDEAPQLLAARGGDVDEVVVGTGDEVHVQHLVDGGELLGELPEMLSCVGLHSNCDHCLQVPAEGGGIDVGMEAADHSAVDQGPHAAQAGRGGGDAREGGEGVVRVRASRES